MVVLGTGVATATDTYAGKTYADASAAASHSGLTVIIATRTGGRLAQADCIITNSQPAPFQHGSPHNVKHAVLFNINCNGGYATATNPGASLLSPQGRQAKAAADAAAASEEQQLTKTAAPGA